MKTTARVKSLQDGIIEGYAVIFDGMDLEGERFMKNTDFMLEHFPVVNAPTMFDHSYDTKVQGSVIGKVLSLKADDVGLWIEAQIDRAKDYGKAILELVEGGYLGMSTGSVPQLVERMGKSITRWPIAELSLTPTPADPRTVDHVGLVKALKALGLETLDNVTEGGTDTTGSVTITGNVQVILDPAAANEAASEVSDPADSAPAASEFDLISFELLSLELSNDEEISDASIGGASREAEESTA